MRRISTIPILVRRHVWLSVAVLVSITVVVALAWRPGSDAGFVEHRMQRRTDIPAAMAVAPDGAVWFTIEMSDAIGVHRNGRIERVSKGTQNLETLGLDVDADGGVWYTDGPAAPSHAWPPTAAFGPSRWRRLSSGSAGWPSLPTTPSGSPTPRRPA